MIKIGIIGSSTISSKFCDAVNLQPDLNHKYQLTANYSRNLEQALKFASNHNIKYSYNNKLHMLETVDLVYIATPNRLHYEDVKLALTNNTHVLVEKPITTTAHQTAELYELAKKHNLVLVEAIKTCSMHTYQHLIKNISIIGKVSSFRLNMMRDYGTFPTTNNIANVYQASMEGGVINDLGSYALFPLIDLIYTDDNYSNIQIKSITENCKLDVEVEIIASLKSKTSGVHGLISLSMINTDNSPSYIYGASGYLTIDSLSQFNTVKYYDLNHNLLQTVTNNHRHLMESEFTHTISLIENQLLASEIHNQAKSTLVGNYLERLHDSTR